VPPSGWLSFLIRKFFEESIKLRFLPNFPFTLEYLDFDVSICEKLNFPSLARHVGHDHYGVFPIMLNAIMNSASFQTAEKFQQFCHPIIHFIPSANGAASWVQLAAPFFGSAATGER
jgi:hypothetical protein